LPEVSLVIPHPSSPYLVMCVQKRWMGGAAQGAPGGRYRPWHHWPAAVLWDHQLRPSFVVCFICTPCLLHQPWPWPWPCERSWVAAGGGYCFSTAASRWSKRVSSVSRKVSWTCRPASVIGQLTDAGASGRDVLGAGGTGVPAGAGVDAQI